jgi:hypothetical protein
LNGKVAVPGLGNRLTTVGIRCADHATPSIHFDDKQRSLGRYSSLADYEQPYLQKITHHQSTGGEMGTITSRVSYSTLPHIRDLQTARSDPDITT